MKCVVENLLQHFHNDVVHAEPQLVLCRLSLYMLGWLSGDESRIVFFLIIQSCFRNSKVVVLHAVFRAWPY